jgi:hypothetical protein
MTDEGGVTIVMRVSLRLFAKPDQVIRPILNTYHISLSDFAAGPNS